MSAQTTVGRFVAAMLALGCLLPSAVVGDGPSQASEIINLGLRGVYFIPNQGQWSDHDVLYGLRTRGLDVAFRESALTMHLSRQSTEASPTRERGIEALTSRARLQAVSESNGEQAALDERAGPPLQMREGQPVRTSGDSLIEQLTLTVTFPGSNAVEPTGAQPQTAKFNYFVGGEGRDTASNIPSFAEVVYENLYDGIDLHVMGSDDGVLKYEFHCAPGADYNQIQIHYDGVDALTIDDSGDLRINTSLGTLGDGKPLVWQALASARVEIPAHFELVDIQTWRIVLEHEVDPTLDLIIDPEVQWMYYLGGSATDSATRLVLNDVQEAFICGVTQSADFEGRTNSWSHRTDAFIAKTSADGEIQWMTYLGGGSYDSGEGVALDPSGFLFVTGQTRSNDFAGRNNSLHGNNEDAFVVRLSQSGTPQWMTYLGGTQREDGLAIACDASGNAIVTGSTWSSDFDGRTNESHGMKDIYLAKIEPSGALAWMAYYGGSDEDDARALAIDDAGNVYLTGRVDSDDFEGRLNATYDSREAYVAKVDGNGTIVWMMYLRGDGPDQGEGIAVAADGSIYLAGSTSSHYYFEGRINQEIGGTDAFIAGVQPSGALEWAAYYGGTSADWCYCMALTAEEEILIGGTTVSPDFVGRSNGYHGFWEGAFILRATRSGDLISMEYLGGSNFSAADDIVADHAGNAVVVGETWAIDFEGHRNSRHGAAVDAFILKSGLREPPRSIDLAVTATCPQGGPFSLYWSRATPREQVAIVYALDQNRFIIPDGRPCAGTTLALDDRGIQMVYLGRSDVAGSGELHVNVGSRACGAFLQLIDLSTCVTSNLERID